MSYLAPIGNGVRFDLGKRSTLMGIERVKTNVNYNITQGRVFQLIPIVNTGLLAETKLTDELSFAAGVFNDVYQRHAASTTAATRPTSARSSTRATCSAFKVDSIVGKNSGIGLLAILPERPRHLRGGNACQTSVLDAVATAQLREALEAWFQFVWSRQFGNSILAKG